MIFNINNKVRFRLTEEGVAAVHKADDLIQESIAGVNPDMIYGSWFAFNKPDADGYYSEQLWRLFEMFGWQMHIATKPLFVDNVLLIEETQQ